MLSALAAGNPSRAAHLLISSRFDRRIEPGTAVDSTFQVLLRLGRNDTFLPTAQKSELLSSPFGATVRARR
jgi:hypothetical protein